MVLPYHLDSLKQAAGLAALQFVGEMDQRVSAIVEERGRLVAHLQELGATVWPSGANFILFRPPNGDGDHVWQELLNRSILVRNTASWPHLEGCLRVTVGEPAENTAFCHALSDILGATS
ncbi:MAG: aminotransferase class I/II-fold pyridoxal phosphate-dependent enzyme [Acidimicrobiales bacterium]